MTDTRSTDLAVIGVGSLAEAVVEGLCADPVGAPTIALSPRNAGRSRRLAERHSSCRVAGSNQDAVDAAGTVLLAVRPQDAPEVLADLTFGPDHAVVSLMASVPLAQLARLVAPATDVSRALPMTAVAGRDATTPVFPAGSRAEQLFAGLGEALPCPDERAIDAASAASATVAAYFSYVDTVGRWLADQGVEPEAAGRYVARIFASVSAELGQDEDLATLLVAHATPGGLNERIERTLRDTGFYARLETTIDDVFHSLH
ncbi:hypothetical protein ASD11_01865 [Aeromicrobium sp. Root495]|uniref:NAD(P)-binding domain-containing protein n=1 Tax=Aeromicrobium sp. Root495 TaxID=1736550 RepID=UPI000701F605|nr:NAD(P)-binding domain-containing protein [Aeromicrobium sp. Root495]KQY58436.1 hypothetical protein ASD11_01865 [Aeromicrobium sp. Root495]